MNISQIKNAIDGLSQEQLLDLNRYIVNKSKQNASLAVYNFKAGDKVTFTARGTVYTGVVVKSPLNIRLPDSVWDGGCEYGLVPTSQSTRLLIAKYLFNNKYVQWDVTNKKR